MIKPKRTFSINLFATNNHIFDVSSWKSIKMIKCNTFLKYNPVTIIADPFLFVRNDCLFLFYEKLVSDKGVIEMINTNDLINWTVPVTVLKRDTHLSYPFVFEDASDIFMIPETHQEKNIQLLKANQNLTKWTFEKEILNGDGYLDSSIFLHKDVYYLFTTTKKNGEYQLHLFFSEKLRGKFLRHPKSPIAVGNSVGRCGGSIFEFENKIYRPAQICKNYYGESLSLFYIKVLTPVDYEEEIEVEKILSKKFKHGGHHFNYTKFNDKLIIATDVMNLKYLFFDKVIKQLKFLLINNRKP